MGQVNINVSCDMKPCAQCGKKGKGYFECTNAPGKYICMDCINKNMERKLSSKKGRRRNNG